MHAQNVTYNLRSQPGVLEPLWYRKQQRTQADHWGAVPFSRPGARLRPEEKQERRDGRRTRKGHHGRSQGWSVLRGRLPPVTDWSHERPRNLGATEWMSQGAQHVKHGEGSWKLGWVICKSEWHLKTLWSESHSVVSDSATPWAVARQAPLSVEFSRQEYWSGLSFTSPGDLPDQGVEPVSPAWQVNSLPPELPGNLVEKARYKWPHILWLCLYELSRLE